MGQSTVLFARMSKTQTIRRAAKERKIVFLHFGCVENTRALSIAHSSFLDSIP